MKFEHAYKGIGKIITAEWFSILATITGAIALLFGVTAWAADHENIKEIFDYTIGGFTIVTLITLLSAQTLAGRRHRRSRSHHIRRRSRPQDVHAQRFENSENSRLTSWPK